MVDNYTKVILTTIAIFLGVIVLNGTGIVSPANANGHGVQKVTICNPGGSACGDDWVILVEDRASYKWFQAIRNQLIIN